MKKGLGLLFVLFLLISPVTAIIFNEYYLDDTNIMYYSGDRIYFRGNLTDLEGNRIYNVQVDISQIPSGQPYPFMMFLINKDNKGYMYRGTFEGNINYDSPGPTPADDPFYNLYISGLFKTQEDTSHNELNGNILGGLNAKTKSGNYFYNISEGMTFQLPSQDNQPNENDNINETLNDHEIRISALETWKQTITNTINNILGTLTSLTNSVNNHETRIQALESSSSGGGGGSSSETFPDYLNYLSSSDRKAIVCGYAEDNHLNNITDLGYNCTLTYRQTSRGETASCRCKVV